MHDQHTLILAMRHGETAWNVEGRIQGHLDVPLNELGQWQAERLAQALRQESLDVVYASDLRRAIQTAEAVVKLGGQPLLTDSGLRERDFGVFQGRTFRDVEIQFPEQAERWRRRDPDYPPGGGESLTVFFSRCTQVITRLALTHPGQTIGVVAHGGVLDCFYRAATHQGLQAPRSWALENASINRLLHSGEVFTLVGWGDTRHLDEEPRDEQEPGLTGPGSAPGSASDRVGSLA